MAKNPYDTLLESAPTSNPYDAILKDGLDQDRTKLRVTARAGQPLAPAEVARARTLARQTGLAEDLVRRNLPAVETEAKLNEYDRLMADAPNAARWVAQSPENAALAKDDLENLSATEKLLRANREYAQRYSWKERTQARVREGILGLKQAFESLLRLPAINRGVEAATTGDYQIGTDPIGNPIMASDAYGPLPDILVEQAKQQGVAAAADLAAAIKPLQERQRLLPQRPATQAMLDAKTAGEAFDAFLTDPVGVLGDVGISSGVQQGPALAVTVATRNVGAAMLVAGGNSGALELGNGLIDYAAKNGVDVSQPDALTAALSDPKFAAAALQYAKTRALVVGGIDALSGGLAGTVLVPEKVIANKIGREAANALVAQPVVQGAMGAAGEAGGELATGEKLQPGQVLAEAVGEFSQAPVEAGAFGLERARESATVQKATNTALQALGLKREVSAAREEQVVLDQAAKAATDSKLRALDPEAYAEAIRAIKGEAADSVILSAEKLNEYLRSKGLDPDLVMTAAAGSADAFHEALVAGGDVAVPMEGYLSVLAPDHHQALREFARLSEDGISAQDAAEVEARAKDIVDQFTASAEGQDGADPTRQVYEDVLGQLLTTTERSVAERQATLIAQRYAARAARRGLGETAWDVYQLSNLRVSREVPETLRARASVDTTIDPLLDRLRAGDIPSERDAMGPSLLEFARELGVRDDRGELRGMDIDKENKPFTRNLLREDGVSLDEVTQRAVERGYFPDVVVDPNAPDTHDTNTLLDAIGEEASGQRKRFADQNRNAALADAREALLALDDYLGRNGIDINTMSNEDLKRLLRGEEARAAGVDDAAILDQPDLRERLLQDGLAAGYTIAEQGDRFAVYTPDGTLIDDTFRARETAETVVAQNMARQAGTLYQGAAGFDQTQTPAFKRWSNDAALVTSADATTHKFKSGEKVVVEAYHGTKRPDRVGEKFMRKRATSGPMAYHTSSPDLASNYAQGKQDTSLAYEDQEYAQWFKFKPKGERTAVDIVRAWYRLDSETKSRIAEMAPKLRLNDDRDAVVVEEGNTSGNGSYDYNLSATRTSWDRVGNPLKALVEDWLNSGNLFNDEEMFMQVLAKAGFPVKDVTYDSPHSEFPFVYKNYIAMQKPLVTSDIPQEVADALNAAAKRDRSRRKPDGGDMWDKNRRTLRDWVEEFNKPDNQYVWTSIPDKVTEVFKSFGYDGIIDWSGKGGGAEALRAPVYVPFTETQVKSAIGNKGTFSPDKQNILFQSENAPDPAIALAKYYSARTWESEDAARENIRRRLVEDNERYAGAFAPTDPAIVDRLEFARGEDGEVRVVGPVEPPPAPVFYSQALRIVEQVPQGKATGEQWLATLRNKGVKDEEIEWLGLAEWLGKRKGITRDDLAGFIRANEIQVKEVTLSDEAGVGDLPDGWEVVRDNVEGGWTVLDDGGDVVAEGDTRAEAIENARDSDERTTTKFSQYQLPGGKNYRELLLTLPSEFGERNAIGNVVQYDSSHFDEPNIVAHVRFNERTDADGKRVLFLEEVQSDWHQAGRKKGYKNNKPMPAEVKQQIAALDARMVALEKANNDTEIGTPEWDANVAEMNAVISEVERISAPYGDATKHAVPDAPFKTTWPELALKRMVRYAAENGFDRVAWTTGEQQAERYDLSKQVRGIYWTRSRGGKRVVSIKPTAGNDIEFAVADDGTIGGIGHEQSGTQFDGKNLAEVVGKEVADQVLAAENGVLSGDGLKVGGEGMAGFYDKILPAAAKKLTKKYGARVGETRIGDKSDAAISANGYRVATERNPVFPSQTNYLIVDEGGEMISGGFSSREGAEARIAEFVEIDKRRAAKSGYAEVHSLDITPPLREAALAGQPLFQRDGKNKRGSIKFDAARTRFDITLFEKADLTTLLHETGHLFLEEMVVDAFTDGTPEQLRVDLDTVLEAYGSDVRVADGIEAVRKALNTPAKGKLVHEQFAEGFESYLWSGKAPSEALRAVFARFKVWFTQVYRLMKDYLTNATPNERVREVMDRLLATDEEIEAARRDMGMEPMFASAADMGVSEREFALYVKATEQKRMADHERLLTEALGQLSRQEKQWWKDREAEIRAEVEAEVNKRPVYAAIAAMTKGTQPDGSPLPEGARAIKLARKPLAEKYGAEFVKRLPRGMTTTEGGISAELASQAYGFPSGDAMVQALVNAPKRERTIADETKHWMEEQYGNMLLDGSIAERAVAAVHNDEQGKVLAAELRALRRKQIEVEPYVKAARAADRDKARAVRAAGESILPEQDEIRAARKAAERIISGRRYRDVRPILYRRAEAKARREAFKFAAAGKVIEAYAAKRREILNYSLYMVATRLREDAEKAVEYVSKFNKKPARERMAGARSDYLERIDDLLAAFDLRPVSLRELDRRQALRAFVEAHLEEGFEPGVAEELIARVEAGRVVNWREAPIEELLGLRDAIKNIEALANLKNQLLSAEGRREWETARTELADRVKQALPEGKAPPISRLELNKLDNIGEGVRGLADSLLRPETIVEWLDGGETGPWHDFLMERANTAQHARDVLREQVIRPLTEVSDKMTRKRLAEMHERINIPSLGFALQRRTLISIALNMGNESNRDKLLRGGFKTEDGFRPFNEKNLQEIVAALSKEDWDFVQTVWDTVESLWPKVVEFQKEMGGLVPPKIEAATVKTPHGDYRGGYFPVVYDPDASPQGEKQAAATTGTSVAEIMGANFTRATTRKSHLKERTEVARPLLLDFERIVSRNIDNVITDLTHRQFIIQASKILSDRELRALIQSRLSVTAYRSLQGMVRHSVHADYGYGDQSADAWSRVQDRLVTNTAVAALGFKAAIAFGNLVLAPIQAGARLKPASILSGVAQFYSAPKATAAFIHERSPFMTHRADHLDASFVETMARLRGENSARAQLARASMQVHRWADFVAVHGLWLGRYQEALKAGSSEAEAVRLADKAIRQTQTAGAPKDLSAFERDPRYKIFKLFLGPMLIMGNRLREAGARKGVVKNWPEAFGTMMAVWLLPAIIWPLATGAGPDDDDEGTLSDEAWWALRKVFFYPFMTIPFIREAASVAERKADGKYGSTRAVPLTEAATLVTEAGEEWLKAGHALAEGEDVDGERVVKDTLRAIGPLVGLPSSQLTVTGEYLWDVYTGQYDPEGVGDLRYLAVRRPEDKR